MTDQAPSTLALLFGVRRIGDDPRLEATDRLVLFALVAFREQDGSIRPSLGQLESATGLARSSVKRSIARLRDADYLDVRAERRGDRNLPNAYALKLERGPVMGLPSVARPVAARPPTHVGPSFGPSGAGGRPAVGHSEDFSSDLSKDPSSETARSGNDESKSETEPRSCVTRLRPLHSGRERGKRDLSIRRLEQPEIVGAFKRGVHEVTGETLTVPKGELADLDDAVDGFCPIWEHTEERYDWIVAKVADYRRAIAGRETFHRSGGARGFLDWLNLGSPTADWLAMTPEQRREAKASDERRAKAALRKKVEKDLARERGEPALEERIAPELAHAELKRLGLA